MQERQLYLCEESGAAIGTATAWWNDEFEGGGWGQIRAVALHPRYQGQRLMHPLLSAVCHRFDELGHPGAFLRTSTKRLPALKLYNCLGFEPYLADDRDIAIWGELQKYF